MVGGGGWGHNYSSLFSVLTSQDPPWSGVHLAIFISFIIFIIGPAQSGWPVTNVLAALLADFYKYFKEKMNSSIKKKAKCNIFQLPKPFIFAARTRLFDLLEYCSLGLPL